MPTFVLFVKAELENVSEIVCPEGHAWCVDVKEAAGDEEKRGVWIDPNESTPLSGSRGEANLVLKFPDSKKESSATVVGLKAKKLTVPEQGAVYSAEAQETDKWQPLLAIDCRGLEPIGWQPRSGYTVVSEGGKRFEDIEIEDGAWCDYDDENDLSVGVDELEWEWRVHKGK